MRAAGKPIKLRPLKGYEERKIMTNLMVLADAAADTGTTGSTGGSIMMLLIYMAFFGVIIYMFMLKPQKKQRAQQEEMLNTLKPGDSIMTTSGFYGTIVGIEDDTVIVEFGNNKNCRIAMNKKAIADVESAEAAYAEEPEEEEKSSKLGKKKK